MAELSNKLLATLVVIAMVISVFGTIASLSKLGEMSPLITGAGTTGSVNLSVESLASINFSFQTGSVLGRPGNISWGSGSVSTGQSYANLTTRGTTTNWNGTPVTGALSLENTGNIGVKLVLTSTNGSAATFLGGTNPIYRLNISENEVNSCNNDSTTTPYDHQQAGLNGSFFSTAVFNVNASRTVCGNFSFQATIDEILIGFYVGLPSDAGAGVHQDIIGATITAAS